MPPSPDVPPKQRRGACRLRRVEHADRQHDQADDEQAGIIRRERRRGIGECQHGERRREQGAAFDPAGQPRRQRRADAQHDRAKGDQQTRTSNTHVEADRQFAQHPRRRQYGTAGDDISEHQCGGSEAALDVEIFHADACRPRRYGIQRLRTGYFAELSRGPNQAVRLSA